MLSTAIITGHHINSVTTDKEKEVKETRQERKGKKECILVRRVFFFKKKKDENKNVKKEKEGDVKAKQTKTETETQPSSRLLGVVEEDDTKDKEAQHHGEVSGIVRIGGDDEALKLVVAEWANSHLLCKVDPRVSEAVVCEMERKDSVDIGDLEGLCKDALLVVLHPEPDVWVQHHKLHLHRVRPVRNPLAVHKLLDIHTGMLSMGGCVRAFIK